MVYQDKNQVDNMYKVYPSLCKANISLNSSP